MRTEWGGFRAGQSPKCGEFTGGQREVGRARNAPASAWRPGSAARPAYNPRKPRQELELTDFRRDFLAFALARDVLRFGDFVTKAGRLTPYFFNAGLFNDGESLHRLGRVLRRSGACIRRGF